MQPISVNGIENIWLYWENKPGTVTPSYIQLCHETIFKANRNVNIHLVTPENISDYLPDFNKDIRIVAKITHGPSLALKTDYIRVLLLEKYGGLWLDSDVIVCKNLYDDVLKKLKDKEFVCIKKKRGHITNGFMASVPGGNIISEYRKRIEEELDKHDTFHWTQIGATLLTPVAEKYPETIHYIDESRVHPVTFDQSEILFRNSLLNRTGDIINDDTLMVMLFNSLFDGSLKNYASFRYWSKERILNEDILISALFRSILSEESEYPCANMNPPEDYYQEIGLIIPTIDRIDSLSEFLSSIHNFFPGISIYIAVQGDQDREKYERLGAEPNVKIFFVPYDYGLSACRNFLVKKVVEKYVFLCDDDFIFTENTDLRTAFKILKCDPAIKIVGGLFLNFYYDEKNVLQRQAYTSFCNIILKNNSDLTAAPVFIPVEYLQLKKHYLTPEIFYLYCDSVNNIALIDKSIFYDEGLWWDDQFRIMGEHEDFYLRAKELDRFKIVYTNALVTEHHRKTNPKFQQMRSRPDGQINLLKKWNYHTLIVLGKRVDRIFRNEYARIPFGSFGNKSRQHLKNKEGKDQKEPSGRLSERKEKVRKLKSEIEGIRSSRSWKLSKPFRAVYGLFGK